MIDIKNTRPVVPTAYLLLSKSAKTKRMNSLTPGPCRAEPDPIPSPPESQSARSRKSFLQRKDPGVFGGFILGVSKGAGKEPPYVYGIYM